MATVSYKSTSYARSINDRKFIVTIVITNVPSLTASKMEKVWNSSDQLRLTGFFFKLLCSADDFLTNQNSITWSPDMEAEFNTIFGC